MKIDWDKNNENALSKEFGHAVAADKQNAQLPSGNAVSRKELDYLKQQRSVPAFKYEYTMDGAIKQKIDAQMNRKLEDRISHIQERLDSAKSRARDDFNRNAENRPDQGFEITR